MNTLAKLILEHLDKAGANMVPDGTLFVELKGMTRPVTTGMDWSIATAFLLRKKFIGSERDELSDERLFYITEAGRVVLLRRNTEASRE